MKNFRKNLLFPGLFVAFCFCFTVCEGSTGPQGSQGENGDPGTDGVLVWQGEYPNEEALIAEKGEPQLNWAYYDEEKGGVYIWDGELWQLLSKNSENSPTSTWIEDLLIFPPRKVNYLMGEPLDFTGLWVLAVYNNHSLRMIYDYSIQGDTFTAGSIPITVVYNKDPTKTASFEITVSGKLIPTGLPVIYINTQNAAPIISKEDWVRMTVKVVSDNPDHCFETISGDDHRIRGRGNTTWGYPKKPYRMRLRPSPGKSMFGLTEAENWVLLADWKTTTLLPTTIAFELGQRFNGPLFKNNYVYVDVVLNGEYQGTYILTEHMRVAPGRVEIDENDDYLVEIDSYWDEDPKFRLQNLKGGDGLGLPIMITSPDYGVNIYDPRYQFVIDSLNEFDAVLSDSNFPNNDWQEIIDIDSFIDYIMINEMVRNNELIHPKSVFMCKVAGEKIRMSHLWDFDWAFGMGGNLSTSASSATRASSKGFFQRFFDDPVFVTKYKARWNEKYSEIQSMSVFIEETAIKIKKSHSLNYKRWYEGTNNSFVFEDEVNKLKTWWNNRAAYLNTNISNR
jgi:hypothetical protein